MASIHLGFASFTVWPVLLVISIVIGSIVTLLSAKKHKTSASLPLLVFLLSGLIVGRIFYIVRFTDSFDGIASFFNIFDGRIDYTAALIASVAVLIWQQRKNEAKKALNTGVFTIFGVYAGFAFLIAVASSHAVLPTSEFVRVDNSTTTLQKVAAQRPVIMNLWATSCDPCVPEMPILAQAEMRHRDIAFIYLNQREPADRVKLYLQSKGAVFENVLIDSRGEIAETKGIFTFPVTLFFDASGQLVYSHSGQISPEILEQSIEQYF
jgi:thiol-disulfide isomerase/thioredoxin